MIEFVQQGKNISFHSQTFHSQSSFFRPFNRTAQQELSEQLDSLIAQLRSIEDIQQTSPEFDTYVHKLINVKHKVTVIYSILQGAQVKRKSFIQNIVFFFVRKCVNISLYYSISQDRLNRIHKQIEREKLKRRSILDSELSIPDTSTIPKL